MHVCVHIALILTPLAVVGCASTDRPNTPGSQAAAQTTEHLMHQEPGPDAIWAFWPASMRIHPLTRIVHDTSTGGRILEARVEFEDAYGHTAKAIGHLRLELFDGIPNRTASNELIGWNIDLRNLDININHFDDVSRTYLARLQLDEDVPLGNAVLRATFNSINDVDLEARYPLAQ